MRSPAALLLPDVKITEAVAVPAAAIGNVRAAHCRVNDVVGRRAIYSGSGSIDDAASVTCGK